MDLAPAGPLVAGRPRGTAEDWPELADLAAHVQAEQEARARKHETAARLAAARCPLRLMAQAVGVSHTAVSKWIKQANEAKDP